MYAFLLSLLIFARNGMLYLVHSVRSPVIVVKCVVSCEA
jgi:hypothetical protein